MKHRSIICVVLFIIILTVLIIGSSLFSQHLLRRDSENLLAEIGITEKCAESGNWKGAEDSMNKAGSIWSGVKGTWSALIDHQEIDNIDVTLSRLQMLVKSKEQPSALSEAAALEKYIGHIPAKEKVSLENLF